MADREDKRIEQDKQYEQWREMSKEHWGPWRAWGSWFSWGSPVGLGLFFVLLSVAFVVVKFGIKL